MSANEIGELDQTASSYAIPRITAQSLRELLFEQSELALLDVRDNFAHAQEGHILLSVSAPFNQLEVQITALVPRRATPVILYDSGADGLAQRSAERLASLGYTDVSILVGGTRAWKAAGFELFTGVHVIGKAFGEFVEHRYETPHISVRDLKSRLDAGENIVVLDSRPEGEFRAFSIPEAINAPGAELVHRFETAVPDPDTLVVVNCAGRTRSIIGAQALINADVPNKVVSLANGTMDWLIEGFSLNAGKSNPAQKPSDDQIAQSKTTTRRLKERFKLQYIDKEDLRTFEEDAQSGTRSLYLLDVRTVEEYEAGHLYGSRSAPGGQLVQQIGQWVGTRNSRLVLIDDPDGVRAAITASWLVQIGWGEVFVLRNIRDEILVSGVDIDAQAIQPPTVPSIEAAGLREALEAGRATVIDLATSLSYEAGHIPGAHFAIRSRLEAADLDDVPGEGSILLTSSDGVQAAFAAADLAARAERPILVLKGGTEGWRAAGYAIEANAGQRIDPFEDVARSAYQTDGDRFAAFRAYLTWEIGLLEQLDRDGTARFRPFTVLQ
jgi:rhodanese-related sulfurtransferase